MGTNAKHDLAQFCAHFCAQNSKCLLNCAPDVLIDGAAGIRRVGGDELEKGQTVLLWDTRINVRSDGVPEVVPPFGVLFGGIHK